MSKLTDKQKFFCEEYLQDFNATRAYVAAGFSKKLANTNASKLLDKPQVKEYIESKQNELTNRLEVQREDIVREYLELIESAKEEGTDGNGTIKDRSNWAKALGQLSRLLGLDEPEKKDITIRGEQPLFGEDETEDIDE